MLPHVVLSLVLVEVQVVQMIDYPDKRFYGQMTKYVRTATRSSQWWCVTSRLSLRKKVFCGKNSNITRRSPAKTALVPIGYAWRNLMPAQS